MSFKRVVAVYIINDKGQVLMLNHKKTGTWLPPGGHVEDNEMIHEAAIREIEEETGMVVEFIYDSLELEKESNQKVEILPSPMLVQLEEGSGYCREDFVYLAKAKSEEIDNKENHEIGWFTLKEAMKLNIFPNVRKHLKYIKEKLGL